MWDGVRENGDTHQATFDIGGRKYRSADRKETPKFCLIRIDAYTV